MPTQWNPDRWQEVGTNDAGDRVYVRVGVEGNKVVPTAVKSSSSMTKAELQELAAERGLPTSGTKDDLLARLSGIA